MRAFCILFFWLGIGLHSFSQTELPAVAEQHIEQMAENSNDVVLNDDSYNQHLYELRRHPININTANPETFNELMILSPLQVESLIEYRQLFGNFISLYELQSIAYWDVYTIKKILPFITITTQLNIKEVFKERVQKGDHVLLIKTSRGIEKSRGYLIDSSSLSNHYLGSPWAISVRYKYQYKNLLQYGFLCDKDPGELIFTKHQQAGFDFYSAHIFIRKLGLIKSLALGDYVVNLGQGLIQWQSLAFKKSSDLLSSKRQSPILKPYQSFGEQNFHRGVGVTVGNKKWEATVFGSYRNIDANMVSDTMNVDGMYVSSFQNTGLHRTLAELADKHVQQQISFGGNASFSKNNGHVGFNFMHYDWKLALIKNSIPSNLFLLTGRSLSNFSIDYHYTYKNVHFFGETAVSSNKSIATVNGLLMSVANCADIHLFYRKISRSYQSLQTNAFTENSTPVNETGFFSALSVRPVYGWVFEAYSDFFTFPWVKYNVNGGSIGSEYLLKITYKPSKQLEIYTSYKTSVKIENSQGDNSINLLPLNTVTHKAMRTQFEYKPTKSTILRSRVEMVWYDNMTNRPEEGYLLYIDWIWKALKKPIGANVRMLFFETESYNSRLYAYENDVLFSSSIPVIYGKGIKYYFNLHVALSKKLTCWVKWAQTSYFNQKIIGSGLDLINNNRKSECKMQVLYHF